MKWIKHFEAYGDNEYYSETTEEYWRYKHLDLSKDERSEITNLLSGIDGLRLKFDGIMMADDVAVYINWKYKDLNLNYIEDFWITICEDEWYYVNHRTIVKENSEVDPIIKNYKCDQFEGLLEFLKDKIVKRVPKKKPSLLKRILKF
jgi:hypothetical protein